VARGGDVMAEKNAGRASKRAKRPAKRRPASSSTESLRAASGASGSEPNNTPKRRTLKLGVVWSDIRAVDAAVILVGHYLGVLPQTAERKLDELVSGTDGRSGEKLIITELTSRAALRGELGEVVFFPAPKGRVAALGGMGSVGTFRAAQVRILARAVGQAVGLLPAHSVLATVLIGSGKGNLRIREACRSASPGRWRGSCARSIARARSSPIGGAS
jgi:hypothetical protein